MGRPKRSNPEHPVNRARLVHAAALKIHQPGYVVPTGTWRRWITIATGAGTRQSAHNYTQLMEDLGMVRPVDAGVELLAPENVLLPESFAAA